jgi:hypothetical protein
MPQVRYTADGLPYYDATDQQTQPYFPQVSGPMLPAPGVPGTPSEGFNQGVRDTLHGMTVQPFHDAARALQGGMTGNEAQDFAFGAALGLLPMGRGLKPKLPMDEASRMARAAEQGYTIDAYKGMNAYHPDSVPDRNWRGEPINGTADRIPAPIDQGQGGRFYSSDPAVASRFAEILGGQFGPDSAAAVFPSKIRMQNPKVIDANGAFAADFQFGKGAGQLKLPKDSPHDGVILKNTKDEGTIYIPREGNQVRSRFAAFDPANKDSSHLLGSILAALGLGVGAANLPIPKAQAPQFQ